MLHHLELSAGGEGGSRLLGKLERIGHGEHSVGRIIPEYRLISAHLRLCDITRRGS